MIRVLSIGQGSVFQPLNRLLGDGFCSTREVFFCPFFVFVWTLVIAQAWIRLSMNLEHVGEGDACLEALRSGAGDHFVSGGEWVEVRQRLATKHQQHGK